MKVQKRNWLSEFVYWLHKDANESPETLMNLHKHIHDCQILC